MGHPSGRPPLWIIDTPICLLSHSTSEFIVQQNRQWVGECWVIGWHGSQFEWVTGHRSRVTVHWPTM